MNGMIVGAFRYKKAKTGFREKAKNLLVNKLHVGKRNGLKPGWQKLSFYFNSTDSDWVAARNIVNGDVRKNGAKIAKTAKKIHACLKLK